jgi:hypothetical protein
MNMRAGYLLWGLAFVILFAGCAKKPSREIGAARSAVDAVMAEGAENYAPEEAKKVNDELTAAMNEIKVQDGQLLKNYGRAKAGLTKVKADAEALKSELLAKKEAARNSALTAQSEAAKTVKEVDSALANATNGKEGHVNIAAMKSDVEGLEESLPDIRKLIDSEDYGAAVEKAEAIRDRAMVISLHLRQVTPGHSVKRK